MSFPYIFSQSQGDLPPSIHLHGNRTSDESILQSGCNYQASQTLVGESTDAIVSHTKEKGKSSPPTGMVWQNTSPWKMPALRASGPVMPAI